MSIQQTPPASARPSFNVADLAVSGNDVVYTGRDGSRSVMAAGAKVHIGPIALDVTVYGRLAPDGMLGYEAALPRRGVSIQPDAKRAIKAAAERAMLSWPSWSIAKQRAKTILTTPPGSKLSGTDDDNPLASEREANVVVGAAAEAAIATTEAAGDFAPDAAEAHASAEAAPAEAAEAASEPATSGRPTFGNRNRR
jgi:hypothetical protein